MTTSTIDIIISRQDLPEKVVEALCYAQAVLTATGVQELHNLSPVEFSRCILPILKAMDGMEDYTSIRLLVYQTSLRHLARINVLEGPRTMTGSPVLRALSDHAQQYEISGETLYPVLLRVS